MGNTSPRARTDTRIALCLALGGPVLACRPPSPAAASAAPPLSLAVTIRPHADGAVADFTLRNVGGGRVWVNARLHMNGYTPPDPFQEISLAVTGPAGAAVPWSCRLRVRLADARDYRTLEPGEEVRVTDPMFGRCYPLARPGTYRVVATYRDGSREPPPPPPGATYVPGPVASQPVEVSARKE